MAILTVCSIVARRERCRCVHISHRRPVCCQVAAVTFQTCDKVVTRFVRGVTGGTRAGDLVMVQRNPGPVSGDVAGIASVGGRGVIGGFAVGYRVVVAGHTGCRRGAVIHPDRGPISGDCGRPRRCWWLTDGLLACRHSQCCCGRSRKSRSSHCGPCEPATSSG